jgi:tetratricopeptide (TPR) repeat protein
MSFLSLFSGPSPEKLEQKGDALAETRLWGQATLAYERALEKLEKRPEPSPEYHNQLSEKITHSKLSLATEHFHMAENLIDGGNFDEARDLISLASTLTTEPRLLHLLKQLFEKIEVFQQQPEPEAPLDGYYGLAETDEDPSPHDASDDEYFFALCGTLPPEVQEAYLRYGENFQSGLIALNEGKFQAAADYLALAMKENPDPGSFIPMELAAAYLHLGKWAEAEALLEPVVRRHPDALPAYHLLCEIYWERKEFQKVTALLSAVPPVQTNSLAVALLKGETHTRAGNFDAAIAFYQDFFDAHGWNDSIAKALATTFEAAGAPDKARELYKELMSRCNSCHTRIDPEIKHKYAELSYAAGLYNTETLELYLSLAREIPENAAEYYDRISHIYTAHDNKLEANRFRSFAKRAQTERISE